MPTDAGPLAPARSGAIDQAMRFSWIYATMSDAAKIKMPARNCAALWLCALLQSSAGPAAASSAIAERTPHVKAAALISRGTTSANTKIAEQSKPNSELLVIALILAAASCVMTRRLVSREDGNRHAAAVAA